MPKHQFMVFPPERGDLCKRAELEITWHTKAKPHNKTTITQVPRNGTGVMAVYLFSMICRVGVSVISPRLTVNPRCLRTLSESRCKDMKIIPYLQINCIKI